MNYLLDKKTVYSNHRRPLSGLSKALWSLVVIVLLLGGGLLVRFLSGPTLAVIGPVRSGSASVSFSLADNFGFLSNRAKLLAENEALRKELGQAAAALTLLSAKQEELLALEQSLGRGQSEGAERMLVAKVLAHAGYLGYDTFMLDQGRENLGTGLSLDLGDPVLVEGGVLLGEIVQIGNRSSLARLYSSAGRQTRVMIGLDNVPAVATGRGGGNFLVSVPAGVKVVHNDIVRTVVGNREYVLGVVGGVESNEQTPFQQIYIKPPLNIYTLRFVSIYNEPNNF